MMRLTDSKEKSRTYFMRHCSSAETKSSTSERSEEPQSFQLDAFYHPTDKLSCSRRTSQWRRIKKNIHSYKKKRQLSPFTTSETHKNWIYVNFIMKAKLYRNINRELSFEEIIEKCGQIGPASLCRYFTNAANSPPHTIDDWYHTRQTLDLCII